MNGEREGVIKFELDHRSTPRHLATSEIGRERLAQLIAWRDILARLSLVGQDAARYDGLGFGNVSVRVPPWTAGPGRRRFVITCTQTGAVRRLDATHVARVDAWSLTGRAGRIVSTGPCEPSSESLTHAAFYDVCAAVRWVFHVHGPLLWRAALEGWIGPVPTTRASVRYGTLQMAREIRRLWRSTALPETRLLAMAGHEDGLIVFGRTAAEAGETLVRYVASAGAAAVARGIDPEL